MNKLNDYLYNGDTVLKILHNYEAALRENAAGEKCSSGIDLAHAEYLRGMIDILEHNDFLTSQSQRIRAFYKHMVEEYPHLAFVFKGRIKSLIRAEEKFNRNLIEAAEQHYSSEEDYAEPGALQRMEAQALESLHDVHDLIAYRIIISVPRCHVPQGKDVRELEKKALYEIAELLPDFLRGRNFVPEITPFAEAHRSTLLSENVRKYYKDFIEFPTETGYQSLHIVFWDNNADCRFEIQLRTKEMDDYAEIGVANHANYEKIQKKEEGGLKIDSGILPFYDEACRRLGLLQELDLSKVDVNMFTAANNILMNDGCGFYRGRLILPYEHLSRFQNDLIDPI